MRDELIQRLNAISVPPTVEGVRGYLYDLGVLLQDTFEDADMNPPDSPDLASELVLAGMLIYEREHREG